MARVFDEPIAGGHSVHAMAEEPAEIPHLLLETTGIAVRIPARRATRVDPLMTLRAE